MQAARLLPAGLVTFVFTDIEGSTQMFRRTGERFPALFERHHEILRTVWTATGGCEVRTDGDSFLVAFDDATNAINACGRAQRALMSEPWPHDAPMRVRIGAHTGLAAPQGDDYIALAVHQAARVVDAAHGGQIVASAETVQHVSQLDGLTLVSRGRYRVRDFDDPVELYQVTGPGLIDALPPLRVLPADHHNLVPASTTVVGRADDLDELARLLMSSRLVSIVGPGGLGKTRVATEYGLRHAREWEHGVWFVDLAPVVDDDLIPLTVADAIATSLTKTRDPMAGVIEHLRDRRALLIIDNCEHLTTGVARCVSELLGRCPATAVVATSREPLGLRGERIWRLPTLAPDNSAVELFHDRAGLSSDVDPAQRDTIVELCRLLDGLPLAIELAAARCDVLTPTDILTRLDSERRFLRSADPMLSPRQRSLDDTIDWSYQLLSPDEQLAFQRVGVFAAGFGLEAASAAVGDGVIDPFEVPELIWSLVSKSLVVSDPAAGTTRYRMLETVRSFAHDQLNRSGELPSAASRLARFYVDSYGPHLEKVDAGVLAERSREIDNLRALVPVVAIADESLAQILACIIVGDARRSSAGAGADEGGRLLALLPAPTPTRVALFAEVAVLAVDGGLLDRGCDLLDQAQDLEAEVGAPVWLHARVQQTRGVISVHRGDLDTARSIAVAGLAESTTPIGRARLLNLLTLVAAEVGALDDARDAAEEALELSRVTGTSETQGTLLSNLAEIELRAGHLPAAAQRQLDSLALAVELGSIQEVSSALIVAARLASMADDWTAATRLQSFADVLLDQISVSLYPSDRILCDQLLAVAAERLGPSQFEHIVYSGRSLSITEALDRARSILSDSASVDPSASTT